MRKLLPLWLYFGLALILLLHCGSSSGHNPSANLPKENPSLATDIQSIFTRSCARSGCHDATGSQAGLILAVGQSHANLVNVPCILEPPTLRVKTGDAVHSYLVIKLEGRQSMGRSMPKIGSITGTELQNIKNWISKGAQNN